LIVVLAQETAIADARGLLSILWNLGKNGWEPEKVRASVEYEDVSLMGDPSLDWAFRSFLGHRGLLGAI
jgi:hypothetical protein